MTSRVPNIRSAVFSTPWAIQPEKLAAIVEYLELRASGVVFTEEELQARAGNPQGRAQTSAQPGVAVIPIAGLISQRAAPGLSTGGGTSTEDVAAALDAALASADVKGIVLDIDSAGGTIQGVEELSQKLYQARGQKPIVALANSLAASAAYWIATGAAELGVTPTGEVGSVGVYAVHTDESKALETAGVKPTIISAGKFKAEGNAFEPLSPDAKQAIQDRVDEYYGMFVKALGRNRNVTQTAVREGFGQGRVVTASQAVTLGMADWVGTMEDAIARVMTKAKRQASASGSKAEAARRVDLEEHLHPAG
jgi:signal peptide peptidase SppA